MNKLIGALRSKMMWFSLALVVLGVLEANIGLFQQFLAPDDFGWFTAAVGMAVAVLRWVTTLPLEDK
ncbi:hypothetical protein [Limnohabitans lacus]|uniref:Uncharacterized protein n=1 Tax=Limnohabitans lacus TaxID=3045173 RepID=A0ABT6X877_9BURK|nr:hypothetical protein [Limnohabitans sp. HM2-2]MDI9234323.1 hypothetical protein [Limnohabitans sp. HM2-2]